MNMHGGVYSMSSVRGTEHAFNFYFVVCRELVMIPVLQSAPKEESKTFNF